MGLERLFPEPRELILDATDIGDPKQETALVELSARLLSDLNHKLNSIASEVELASALRTGKLRHALITKDARAFLERVTVH